MLFTTPGQFAVLAIVLVAGWLLGLASASGGRKWRDRYAAEREAHAAYRKDADARVAEAERRRAEIERDHARLAKVAQVTPARSARPAYPAGTTRPRRGWFDWR